MIDVQVVRIVNHIRRDEDSRQQHKLAIPRTTAFYKLSNNNGKGYHDKLEERHPRDVPPGEEPVRNGVGFVEVGIETEQEVRHHQVSNADQDENDNPSLQSAIFNGVRPVPTAFGFRGRRAAVCRRD